MTSLQLKHGFGKTASGNLNKKQNEGKFKQIELGDQDVEMFSPQFLQSKTLKKPLADYGLKFSKTSFMKAENDKTQKNAIANNFYFQPLKSMEDFNSNLNKTQKIDYTFIALDSTTKIKPAYKPVQDDITLKNNKPSTDLQFSLDDKNTIFSAIMKKGSKPKKSITFAETNDKQLEQKSVEVERKVGKAQNKLKQLFNKNVTKPSSFSQIESKKTQNKKSNQNQDIEEEIQQSINEYGEEDFENYSGQSGIKQSIREELAASSGSGFIKQSIREQFGASSVGKGRKSQIMEDIQESIKASISASKQQIPQFIGSYKTSKSNIKQEIPESLSGSRKSAQSVYQQIFEDYEESLKNSRSAFKKSNNFKDSDVLSKSFRKKTNVVKSIKLAEQINIQHKLDSKDESKKKNQNQNKYTEQLLKEKTQIMKKKADISELFNKKSQAYQIPEKNKNLFYQFRIQLNKLLTSQNFESKLKKLTSFINFGQNDTKNAINSLEDKILSNILGHINDIKKSAVGSDQVQRLKSEYEDKLNTMLKNQQINLRVQMDRKLQQKDMQLKKMIAELQKKFQGKAFASAGAKINNFMSNNQNFQGQNSGLYEMQSDYSIDSDNVSWKADLWEVLPQYEKRKLYEKQTKQVTNFLTDIMINQLKEESLCRDLDISFEFPDEFNTSNDKSSNLPSINSGRKLQSSQDMMPKAAFNRKQFEENISVSHPPKKESIFPDFPRPKIHTSEDFDLNKKESVNQYSKNQGQQIPESTKKLKLEKEKVLQILSKYKSSYIRKKNDVIRKILKTLKPKDMKKVPEQTLSVIQQITILSKEDINPNDMVYVRAYEQEIIWALTNIMVKNQNKKTQVIEEQMRKSYERLIVLCQAKVAENAEEVVCLSIYQDNKDLAKIKSNINSMTVKPCPLQIPFKQQAVDLIQKKEQKKIKNQLVDDIINILMLEFAKDFPKRKK